MQNITSNTMSTTNDISDIISNIKSITSDILNINCDIQKRIKMDEKVKKKWTNTYENGQKHKKITSAIQNIISDIQKITNIQKKWTNTEKAYGVLGIFRVVSEFNAQYIMKIIIGFYTKVLIAYFLCTR